MEFDILQYIIEANYIIIAVLLVIGKFIKQINDEFIPNKFIPLILTAIAISLIALQADQFTASTIFDIITQGILTAGAAVLIYEIPKQLKKD